MNKPIKVVGVSLNVGLPKSQIQRLRGELNGLADLSDEEIVTALVEDILDRYFHIEYFDLEVLS